jgi:hypothetical protein
LGFHPSNKVTTIKKHNTYIKEYTVINIPGFIDNNIEVLLGKSTKKDQATDYSEFTINEFLATHYSIDPTGKPLFNAVMGPYNGTRLFIIKDKTASAGKRLLEHIHYDMIRFMSQAAGQSVIADFSNMQRKSSSKTSWAPTWFERQMALPASEDFTDNQYTGKRKK